MNDGIRGPVVITGTDTGVGKTIVTAAVAAAAMARGLRVAVVKPAQTGILAGRAGDLAPESDVAVVERLAAPTTALTLATYPEPLAPATAARVARLASLECDAVRAAVGELADHDLVLIEGAGGLLVPMGARGWTVADLAVSLAAPVVVVTRAGLGTLNHTALTLEALARRGVEALVVVGAWPAEPRLVHHTNIEDLPRLAGVLPERAGMLTPETFRASAPSWLAPPLYGHLDPHHLNLAPPLAR